MYELILKMNQNKASILDPARFKEKKDKLDQRDKK